MEEASQILEIDLISAQGLKTPYANLRRMQTYAVLWVDASAKLRTRIDRLGCENPTWNDKFLFRVSPEFVSSDTSGVCIQIYAAGYLKDFLVGTVRLLLSSCIPNVSVAKISTPAFQAVQVRRASGRFHGILNIAATVYSSSDFAMMDGASAICFRDLLRESRGWARLSLGGSWRSDQSSGGEGVAGSKRSEQSSGGESWGELSAGESVDFSDGAESTTSSSSAASTALKDWNGGTKVEGAGKKGLRIDGPGLLCGLGLQRKIQFCPSDQNLRFCGIPLVRDSP